MLPEQVGVAAEHLLVHVFELVVEATWEARGFAAPVVRLFRARDLWLRGGGDLVGGEDFGVADFAVHPGLNVFDVDWGWKVDRVAFGVDPGVGSSVIFV